MKKSKTEAEEVAVVAEEVAVVAEEVAVVVVAEEAGAAGVVVEVKVFDS